jgi:hypothetical protein
MQWENHLRPSLRYKCKNAICYTRVAPFTRNPSILHTQLPNDIPVSSKLNPVRWPASFGSCSIVHVLTNVQLFTEIAAMCTLHEPDAGEILE